MNTSPKSFTSNPEIILEMRNIFKSFSGTEALHNVNFEVQRGEVHLVLGENGAGKSTLMKILAGVHPCDTGQMLWHGQPVQFNTPRETQKAGINIIYQESSLIPHLSVAENVFLGNEPARLPGLPLINWDQMYEQTRQLMSRLNLAIDPQTPVSSLGVAEQRMAELLSGEEVPYILETPSTVVDINNVADYKSGATWTFPVEGEPELDNGLPSGEFAK